MEFDEKSLNYLSEIADLLQIEESSDNPYGYDFYKTILDSHMSRIEDFTPSDCLELLSSIIMHHGANMPDSIRDEIINFSEDNNLVDDIVSYRDNNPIPQFIFNNNYVVNSPF